MEGKIKQNYCGYWICSVDRENRKSEAKLLFLFLTAQLFIVLEKTGKIEENIIIMSVLGY